MGTRLGKYTEQKPKCMLVFEGKTLIERQVEALRSAGVNDICIVRGYQAEKIDIAGVKYFLNPEFESTNMAATLMAAASEFETPGGCLVCYADIIYQPELIRKLAASRADVNVLVDDEWVDYWSARLDDWRSDIESLQYDSYDNITDIGEPRCSIDRAQSRYIGLLKFSERGATEFIRAYNENAALHWNSPAAWRRSKSFRLAYMTCMLQELVDREVVVKAVHVQHGWLEFDTIEDYEKSAAWKENGKLNTLIDLEAQ